jgi:transcriptional regulator with XRE-family HTH domain
MEPDAIGARIREARERAGMTQAELAESVGGGQPEVSMWEIGKRTPGLGSMVRLAGALGVSVDWLATGATGSPAPR